MKKKLMTTEDGFIFEIANGKSIICAKVIHRRELKYKYSLVAEKNRVGQVIDSKKLPNEQDKSRDRSIIEILSSDKVGLKEEAEKIIADLVESFNLLPMEDLENLRTYTKEEASPRNKEQQYSSVELFDLVGEAFEGVSVFNEAVSCYNKGIVYEHKIPRQNSKSGAQSFRTEYNLYCLKLSKYISSNANYPIAVVTPGHVLLPAGEVELYLRPSTELLKGKSPLSSPICDQGTFREVVLKEEYRIESEEGVGEDRVSLSTETMWENFLNSGRIFEVTTPVPIDELKKVKNVDAVLELALTDGLKKDLGLVTFMKAHIPKPDTNVLTPDGYMPYAPNSIVVTNTKTGKTTTAMRISKNVVNRPTVSSLLGFSTAKETHIGLLDVQTDTCFVDEITENVDENISAGLLSYLETGITRTARGHGVSTRGFAPVAFMGNPKIEGTSDYDLLDYFRNIINQITNNPQALGSRIGFLIFDNKMEQVTGLAYDYEISKKSLMVLKTLQEAYKRQFSDLFRNREILAWLNAPFEDWFIVSLNEISNKSTLNQVKEFINGLKDSRRHVRGSALHIAFTESYEVLLESGILNIQEFLEKCDQWYQYLLSRMVQTLNQIVSIQLDNIIYLKILDSAPDYIKLFVKTSFLFGLDSGMLPLDSFESLYKQNASITGKYINFGNLKNAVLKNKTKSYELLKRFGLKLTDYNGIILVGVTDKELYQVFRGTYRETEGAQGSQGSKNYSEAYSEPSEPNEPDNLSKGGRKCCVCNDTLKEGEGVKFLQGRGMIHPSCKFLPIEIEVLVDIPKFIGADDRTYGPLKKGEVKAIPALNAFSLIGKKAAIKTKKATKTILFLSATESFEATCDYCGERRFLSWKDAEGNRVCGECRREAMEEGYD